MEGANDSLNLHDASALEKLPQLTSTPGDRSVQVHSPIVHSQDFPVAAAPSDPRNDNSTNKAVSGQSKKKDSEASSELTVTPDVKEKKGNQRSKTHRNVPEHSAEDLVVLSFSSSAGMHKQSAAD